MTAAAPPFGARKSENHPPGVEGWQNDPRGENIRQLAGTNQGGIAYESKNKTYKAVELIALDRKSVV